MGFYWFAENFLNASVSALGAFVPALCLMYLHYCIRKNNYQRKKQGIIKMHEAYQKLVNINDEVIQKIYISAGVSNFHELLDNPIGLAHLDKFQYVRLVNYVNQQLDQKIKNFKSLNKMTMDMRYIDSYDFKTYLSSLLDKRFPDKRFG